MIEKLFQKQKENSLRLRSSNAHERKINLTVFKQMILQNQGLIYQSLWQDFSKPETESYLTEIYPLLTEIDFALKNINDWVKQKNVATPISLGCGRSWIKYEPKGTSLIVAPWNYPVLLALSPIVSALAAGCTVILKPSEISTHTSLTLKKLIAMHFPEQLIAVVEGGLEETTQLLQLPFDHIFFTGSTEVGKIFMQAAAQNLSSLTLELGGKSPVIVDSSADLKLAAQKIAWGKLINAGQTCIAPDYLFIEESIWPTFKTLLTATFEKYYPASSNLKDLAQIINVKHLQRLESMIQEAYETGAEFIAGGKVDHQQRKIYPTILKISHQQCKMMQEEIFGPILPVMTYKSLNEVIHYINQNPKPLSLYLFANDQKVIEDILTKTSSGGVCINEVLLHLANHNLPFGGVNHSGIGHYHGYFGFKAFSHEKAVYQQSRFGRLFMFLYPPYSLEKLKWLKIIMRFF